MAKNVIRLTESDIRKMVENTVRLIKESMDEESQKTEAYWESPDGNEKAWEKVEVSTSEKNNTDPYAEMSEVSDESEDILGKSISAGSSSNSDSDSKDSGKHDMDNNYDNADHDFSDDATDVKDNDNSKDGPKGDAVADGNTNKSNGTQFNQGGDPFSQRIEKDGKPNDNAETSKGEFHGWGDSLDNIVNDEIKKAINEIRKRTNIG